MSDIATVSNFGGLTDGELRAFEEGLANGMAIVAAREITITALRKRVEALEGALAKAQAAILTADMMDDRYNAAGHLTDRALWHDRAISIIDAAFDGCTDGR